MNSGAGNLVVDARTLSSFVAEQRIGEINLIKIDVQVAEVDFCRAADKYLTV